ncbi:MarR family winged helix-turn-helix transcriptional regulator [Variovorax saccharolyticus]|uniref:MarR family winged helix-turn-helix transcriptional regulator n=1 Tax=Variovorax saccharolyticus TaxID=3053516 RepID=UPI0025768402|nr:MarR family winged helix-turn-helix transcriptional regulator [Variovorax sp. J31P216]MDM0025493.1 MarR family winged helix-turn-helix transcriptional regulator [Variovorax sp. J31P216]
MTTSARANDERPSSQKKQRRASVAQVAAHSPEALITYRVSVLAQALSRLVDASVQSSIGLTSRQWRCLVILNRLGTSPSGTVARMASFDHSQVSRVALELTEKGLITQVSDAGDRRKQILSLTPAGVECLRNGIPHSLQRQARLQARLEPAEYEIFCRALNVLQDEAQKMLEDVKEGE